MKMIDVGWKFENLRTAKAVGRIRLSPETVKKIKEGKIEKGDVLSASKLAGIIGAKKTPELMPFCHPIPLDVVSVEANLGEDFIEFEVEVKGVWRTGYEVEAMVGVMTALINVFDMCKAVDNGMVIEEVKIVEKSGGKSDWAEDLEGLKCAVITVSDSASKGLREDESGKLAIEILKKYKGEVVLYKIVPDEKEEIKKTLKECKEKKVNLVITTGGTGFGPRDVTPEALSELEEKSAPGFEEAVRILGVKFTPKSLMSRSKACFIDKECLVISLPGSKKAVVQNLNMLLPLVKHAIRMARGEGH
jgi:molybdenum cofactor biosynthesis protein MoaC